MSLTNRLNLFFLAALAGVLTAFSVGLYLLADFHLTRQLDDRLVGAARLLSAVAEVDPDGVEWDKARRPASLGPGEFGEQVCWAVTDENAQIVDHSPQPGVEGVLTEAEQAVRLGHRNPRTLEHDDREWRVTRICVGPETPLPPERVAADKHPALVITAAVPLDRVTATLRTLTVALAGLTVVVLLLAMVAGRAVCRRALTPVARMADAARGMGAAERSERLPVPASADEVANLGQAFNGLLDRLGEAFEREKRFAGEASHQLRTPLTALTGQLEVALRRDRTTDEYRRVLEGVLSQAGRLRRIVESLLFLARSESDAALPTRERLDLAVWVPERLQGWMNHPRAAELTFETKTGGPAWATVHPDLFAGVVEELIENALKYSQAGTRVTVRIGVDGAGPWLEVEDDGCGIGEDDRPHLFRSFFRSDAARRTGAPGAGLGLAVAARVVAAHGGEIEVESELGRGSRFRVRLLERKKGGSTTEDREGSPV